MMASSTIGYLGSGRTFVIDI